MTDSARQFDAQADRYAASEVHRAGASLPVLLEFAASHPDDLALDVATGTGNTALALAPLVREVTGLDLAQKMLVHARERAAAESRANASFVVGSAEALPFADGSFTLVTSRHAPHHFRDVGQFLAEVWRVLRPGGRLVLADQISPDSETRRWIDRYQTLRDPSHFTQRTADDWRELAEAVGFRWARDAVVPYRLDFMWWTETAGTPAAAVAELRALAADLSPEGRGRAGLEVGPDGELLAHTEPMLVVRLEKPED
ncbi:class I SAM-dependent methyltransferase [Deinococcus sp. Leaf326]|uniref:class I SAM-dependent methyltransferase n=1 Tax=Deinococcus sp. Leaf326 TaxID=1736338 RepID=UPI000700007C|nr:class I SAM-dependent methyltransferase [Deinococcus sp. Leaf326]KQR04583.1 ubiquinone biosynthesis methyltransferase UbiE [Deinococcus sp. Leaf326]